MGTLSGALLQDTYQVGDLLGSGGMGDVYLASHARLNRQFAVKILHPQVAKNREAFARFRREAQITSELGHPHIIQVIDFNTLPDGSPYIVMEYLEGEGLDARIERWRVVPVDIALSIADQLGSALGAAHAKGVVHRDLKPQNIFLTHVPDDDWYVKILDFGISKIKGSTSIVTQDNSLIGTPYYMSPEQAEGKADLVDHRTDQFALAVMVYELVTGRNPFEGDSIPSVLYHVVHTTPPPANVVNPQVPPVMSMALARGMAKRSDERFDSIKEFTRALRGVPATADSARLSLPPRPTGIDPLGATSMSTPMPSMMTPGAGITSPAGMTGRGTHSGGARDASQPSLPLPAAAQATYQDELDRPARRRSKAPLLIGALLAVAALGIGAVVLFGGGGGDDAEDGAAEPASAAAAAPPATAPTVPPPVDTGPTALPADPIRITFSVDPAPERVLVDGKPVKLNNGALEMVPDNASHVARLEKQGHVAEDVTFTADSSQVIRARLGKVAAASGKTRPGGRSGKSGKGKTGTGKSGTGKNDGGFVLDLDQ